ncbi:MAG: hypothetical protein ACI9K9_001442 [Neolewinella sp.]|jgi:hypothetical protein
MFKIIVCVAVHQSIFYSADGNRLSGSRFFFGNNFLMPVILYYYLFRHPNPKDLPVPKYPSGNFDTC